MELPERLYNKQYKMLQQIKQSSLDTKEKIYFLKSGKYEDEVNGRFLTIKSQ